MTIVSGIARRMTAVVDNSGFSARLAAAAGPMRPCAQAVASAGNPMASAAASPSNAVSINSLSRRTSPRRMPVPERVVLCAARTEELAEEFHVMQPQGMNGRTEDPDGEVHQVKQQRKHDSDEDAAHRANHVVGDDGQHQ